MTKIIMTNVTIINSNNKYETDVIIIITSIFA